MLLHSSPEARYVKSESEYIDRRKSKSKNRRKFILLLLLFLFVFYFHSAGASPRPTVQSLCRSTVWNLRREQLLFCI